MTNKKLCIALLFLVLVGCDIKPDFDNYIGFWHISGGEKNSKQIVAEIQKNNDSYIFIDDHLKEFTYKFGGKSRSYPLSISDEQLVFKTGEGELPLVTINEGNNLIFRNKTYNKISINEFEKIKNKLQKLKKSEKEKSIKDAASCNELRTEYFQLKNKKDQDLNGKEWKGPAWNKITKQWNKTKEKFKNLENQIERCHLNITWHD